MNGSIQMSIRVRMCSNRLAISRAAEQEQDQPDDDEADPPRRRVQQGEEDAEEQQRRAEVALDTTMPRAIAHIATIGARYGSGGRRSGPTRVSWSTRSARFSDR